MRDWSKFVDLAFPLNRHSRPPLNGLELSEQVINDVFVVRIVEHLGVECEDLETSSYSTI